jgi:3-phosphoshikimate 1-carboxyvinyltransferase
VSDPASAATAATKVRAWRVTGGAPLVGRAVVPGDKSITHRALVLAAIADGTSRLVGHADGEDVGRTLAALRALGVHAEADGPELVVHGMGLDGLRAPGAPLDCGNSGTTMRLLAGLLAGRPFEVELVGDASLMRRPMRRIVEPLSRMGARIEGGRGEDGELRAPLRLLGGQLRGMDHRLAVPSAQVKTALMLAALRARGPTTIREPAPSRDHGERLLRRGGAPLRHTEGCWRIDPSAWDGRLRALRLDVPGDPSSAAFLLVAALLVPAGDVTVAGVALNPGRTGFIEVLGEMGARLLVSPAPAGGEADEEPRGDVRAEVSSLTASEVGGERALRAIDEIPVLAVAATQALGRTIFADAAELRRKESDRLAGAATLLSRMGAAIEARDDRLLVRGPTRLRAATFGEADVGLDHRVAMTLVVAALCAAGESEIAGLEAAGTSFPGFLSTLRSLGAKLTAVEHAC